MTANTYGRQVVIPLTNKSGGGVIAGDVVVIDTTNNDAFTTSTAGAVTGGVGIAQETIANNATGRVLTSGYAALVNTSASVTRGNYGKTHTVVKQAVDAGASRATGTFCQFLTGGTTPDALVYPVDLAGTALTNPMTTAGDIIYGGASGTPTRLAGSTSGYVLTSTGATSAPNWAAGGGALTSSSTQLGADVTIANGSWSDIVSLSLAAGTWLIFFTGTILTAGAGGNVYVEVYDGTTEYTATAISATVTGVYYLVAVTSPPITLGGTTTVKIRAQANAAGIKMETTTILTNKTSTMVALKIA